MTVAAPWRWNSDLPDVLPVGGLTVVALGDPDSGRPGDWPLAVISPLGAAVAAGRPAVYVDCGGFDGACTAEVRARFPDPSVVAHLDEDVTVFLPEYRATVVEGVPAMLHRPWYDCIVPTVHSIRPTIMAHELAFGPALLMLDGVEHARPYWQACTDDADLRLRSGLVLSEVQAHRWRADDLAALAEQRPDAPTVAVIDHHGADTAALDALRDVAMCSVQVVADSERTFVSAASRSSTLLAWPPPRRVAVPRY